MIATIEGPDPITEERFVEVMMSFDGERKLTNNPAYTTTIGYDWKSISNRAYFGQSKSELGLKDPIFPESSLNYFLSYFADPEYVVANICMF